MTEITEDTINNYSHIYGFFWKKTKKLLGEGKSEKDVQDILTHELKVRMTNSRALHTEVFDVYAKQIDWEEIASKFIDSQLKKEE
jgi:hypothetical protein